jgi:hypothetical protein
VQEGRDGDRGHGAGARRSHDAEFEIRPQPLVGRRTASSASAQNPNALAVMFLDLSRSDLPATFKQCFTSEGKKK